MANDPGVRLREISGPVTVTNCAFDNNGIDGLSVESSVVGDLEIVGGSADGNADDGFARLCSSMGIAKGTYGFVDDLYFCPHHPEKGWEGEVPELKIDCTCRKPKPGLLEQLARHFDTSLDDVPVIGDSLRDLEAAAAVGARPILVRTGKGRDTEASLPEQFAGVPVYDDLAAAARATATAARPISVRSSGSMAADGASSTTFWLRRWIEHSRSPRWTAAPCVSATTCTSMCRGRSTSFSTYTRSSPNYA